ncbi:MAG: type II toxin-antitoxin system antitoxin SocA domain-containing protein [Terracidiphilus sp.]
MLQYSAKTDKFKALVHYICWRCANDPSKLGAVKLNKALWIADLGAYYYLGKPITRSRYVKRQFGPTPKAILPVLRELQAEGKLEIREDDFHGKKKRTFISLQDPSMEFMSEEEKRLADAATELVCEKHTATSISNKSHDHIWKAAEDGEELPFSTVFVTPDTISDEDREWAREQLEKAAGELDEDAA